MKHSSWLLMTSLLFMSLILTSEMAAARAVRRSTMTYDLAAATGAYNDEGYTELHLGLNWYWLEWLNWRNAAFSRFGSKSDSIFGLDTSFRYELRQKFSEEGNGFHFYLGPGYRISEEKRSGGFLEGGILFQIGGLGLGAGFKSLYYPKPGMDAAGKDYAHSDVSIYLLIAAGGSL